MKTITFFYLPDCPYCQRANRVIEALQKENEAFRGAVFERVDERREPDKTRGFDYWYVPSMFVAGEKVYEAHPGETEQDTREGVLRAMEAALSD